MIATNLPRKVIDAIIDDCKSSPDEERCGVIMDRFEWSCLINPSIYVRMPNELPEAERKNRFKISGIKVEEWLREDFIEKIKAIVHTHPGGTAYPSEEDLKSFPQGHVEFGLICAPDKEPGHFWFVAYNQDGVISMEKVEASNG